MARELGGKHVVVVGATGALGARIAAHLAAAGARVSAIVRDHTRLDGASVFQYALADVTDSGALRLAFASVATAAPIDGVVNATGVVAFGRIDELDDTTLASSMSSAAAERGRRYTWSFAAARLRRLYSDITSRSLVHCT